MKATKASVLFVAVLVVLATGTATAFVASGTDQQAVSDTAAAHQYADSSNASAKPSFEVSNLSAPTSATEGDTITVTVDVTNPSAKPLVQEVEFRIEGTVVQRQYWALNPGETNTLTFEIDTTGVSPGVYIHGVYTRNDGLLGSITISESGGQPETETPRTETPTVETETPSAETETPMAETETPTAETETPSAETETPSVETETPMAETETPSVETETPTAETETPSAETKTPMIETETPSTETETPRVETETPTVETETPTVETETPSAETETPSAPAEAAVTFDDQTLDDDTVTIASVTLPEGGFVAVVDQDGQIVGASDYLDAGTHSNVDVDLARSADGGEPQARSTLLIAIVHQDTNDNRQLDFVTSNGSVDGPYLTDGRLSLDYAVVDVDSQQTGQS